MPASHRHPALARLAEHPWWLLLAAIALTIAVYAPGLSGGWLFDDYPNIVDNPGVQPHDADLGTLVRAALSSPSSEFKRPLASLSFAANYLAAGLDPYWMKLTNLVIHLLNGVAACLLAYALLRRLRERMAAVLAALIASAWLLLPINLTGVLYVVQRMESMANLFVLVGLIGYVHARCRLQDATDGKGTWRYYLLCAASLVFPTGIGLLAKETAVMLPLYAALIEWIVFGFRNSEGRFDRKIAALFLLVLVLPLIVGVAWLLPGVLRPSTWATRDFTLTTRLLSEARIVTDYIGWTILPSPEALSFYHDDFVPSSGWLHPWTTLAGMLALLALFALALWWRRRRPLAALGILLFLGCHLLTGTILPLELVYEHRNYFASFGLLLTLVPLLAAPRPHAGDPVPTGRSGPLPMALPRQVALGMLMLFWITQTATSAYAWGDPLRLSAELADRAPASPRAQYELGRTYIIYSHYDPDSPFTALAYEPLERAMKLPDSSILPEQALIFMNSRMGLTLKAAWWDSMVAKLKAQKPGVQDESSIGALTSCQREMACNLPKERMVEVFQAALAHPSPNARLLATYSDYAWNVLGDHKLGMQMIDAAVKAAPEEPAYRITQTRMLAALGRTEAAREAYRQLQRLNIGGRLDKDLAALHYLDAQPL
jgi:tetratricopeptide (TPR) repeat protein